jgi:hypothetical protein
MLKPNALLLGSRFECFDYQLFTQSLKGKVHGRQSTAHGNTIRVDCDRTCITVDCRPWTVD